MVGDYWYLLPDISPLTCQEINNITVQNCTIVSTITSILLAFFFFKKKTVLKSTIATRLDVKICHHVMKNHKTISSKFYNAKSCPSPSPMLIWLIKACENDM